VLSDKTSREGSNAAFPALSPTRGWVGNGEQALLSGVVGWENGGMAISSAELSSKTSREGTNAAFPALSPTRGWVGNGDQAFLSGVVV
jgi:hypothetical protein